MSDALSRIEALLKQLVQNTTREAYSLRQAARILGISRNSLPALIRSGAIKVIDIAGHKRISRKELDRVLSEGASTMAPALKERRQAAKSWPDELEAIKSIKI